MYIRFGPPDEIEPHPSGGSYQRPPEEGGGTTSTYPFEKWRYRHLDNVGDNVILEFVDRSMSGEYRLAFDPCEKDALKYVPGAGPTQSEQLGMSTRSDRFQNTNGTTCGAPIGGKSFNAFDQLTLLANVEKAPAVKFKDLEEAISSHISFNTLPMAVQVDYLRITEFTVLTNITLQFENRDLSFRSNDGMEKSVVNVFGRVFTMTRRPVATFEKPIEISTPTNLLPEYAQRKSVYQESLPLTPGRYKLDIVARDTVSGAMNKFEVALDVPRFDPEKLAISSLILADSIQPLPTRKINGEMFAIGSFKVRPRVNRQYRRDEKLLVYLQVYNLKNPESIVNFQISPVGDAKTVLEFSADVGSANQDSVKEMIPLNTLAPGEYNLRLKVSDGDRTLQHQVNFTVQP
jgi:hypothetical protein